MKDFAQLKKNLKGDFSDFQNIKIALLGDSSTQFLSQALRGEGYERELDLDIWEADYNQIEQQVFDEASELYNFNPSIVILFRSTHKLLGKYNKLNPREYSFLASKELEVIQRISSHLTNTLNATIIYYNYYEINASVLGNFSNKTESSFLFQLRKLNYELMCFVANQPKIHICDLSSIHNLVGHETFFRSSMYMNSEMVLSIDILPVVADRTVNLISALIGRFKKCIILDLDNTIWGGVIGDDGLEKIQIGNLGIGKAFTEFQYWIKKLKNRGIIIAICSKNSESVAKEPFLKHPEMVLHLEDISVFIANWENKADNIRKIQCILNIGFDSMVFLDDNPFERNIVKENIPGIIVPELPEDPSDYLPYLYNLNLFETVSVSKEDGDRTKYYQIESQRVKVQESFTNVNDYLKSLDMMSTLEPFNKFNGPRVSQLSQRSNQFNLRTVRYSEDEVDKLSFSDEHITFAFSLEDKFGDNGLICVVVLFMEDEEILFIENWFMSCRVLKRGMENFVLNTIAAISRKQGFTTLKGEYQPTLKNVLVKDHYPDLGFEKKGVYWELSLSKYLQKGSVIKLRINDKGSYYKSGAEYFC